MKTALLASVIFSLIIPTAFSQIVSNVPLQEINTEYISIHPAGYKAGKSLIRMDFGQYNEAYNYKGRLIKDENGKALEFNSMIDALNLLNNFGYELVEVIPDSSGISQGYILRRKKS